MVGPAVEAEAEVDCWLVVLWEVQEGQMERQRYHRPGWDWRRSYAHEVRHERNRRDMLVGSSRMAVQREHQAEVLKKRHGRKK